MGATPGVAAKLYYIEADALGTPRAIIDPVRDVAVWRWELSGEAFGDSAPDQDPDGDATPFVFDLRFPGQRYDAVSGLNYNYFRDYDPGTGRYVQSDPIGLRGGISTYGYVGGNALRNIDPLGLASPSPGVALPRPIAQPLPRIPAFEIPAWIRGLARVGSGPVGAVIGSLWPTPMGVSECEAPGVDFNACMQRVYNQAPDPAPPLPDDPAQCPGDGWEWRGNGPPGSGKGNWVNPETGGKLHPDFGHPPPKGPHWGYSDVDGNKWDFFPDGRGWQPGDKKWK